MGIIRDGMEGKDGVLRSEVTLKMSERVEIALVRLLDTVASVLGRFVK